MPNDEEIVALGFRNKEDLLTNIWVCFRQMLNCIFEFDTSLEMERKFYAEYIPEMKFTKMGNKGLLISHKGLDFEIFFVSRTRRYSRLGVSVIFYLDGAEPFDWALKVFKETVNLAGGDRVTYHLANPDDDGFDINDYVPLDIITPNGIETVNAVDSGLLTIKDMAKQGMAHYGIYSNDIIWFKTERRNNLQYPLAREWLKELSRVWELFGSKTIVKKCELCDNKIINAYDSSLCPKCSDDFITCDSCGKLEREENCTFEKMRLCGKCSKLKGCKMCGVKITDEANIIGICEGCVATLSSNRRLNYHSRNSNGTDYGRTDLSGGSRFKCGLEIEKEDEEVLSKLNLLDLGKRGWISERDGSLSESSGFELVSPIYPLEPDFIIKEMQEIKQYINAKATKKCGGHIHVSDTQRTPFDILRDIQGYLPLLYMLYPDRATNDYCKATEVRYYLDNVGGHHQAINPNSKTLEFRIFPAVKNIESVQFRLNLVKHMLENPRELSVDVGKELLNNESGLFKVLSSVLKPSNIKKKAEAFVDLANYIDREGLVFNGNDIDMPRLNQYKEKDREEIKQKIEALKQKYPSPIPKSLRNIKRFNKENYGKFGNDLPIESEGEEGRFGNIVRDYQSFITSASRSPF